MIGTTRDMLLLAGAASLASLLTGGAAWAEDAAALRPVEALAAASEAAHSALMAGDVDTYLAKLTLADDFTLMSPFGGTVGRGPHTRDRLDAIGKVFRKGSMRQEIVETYAVADMVVLAVIEHNHGEVGGLPAQDWPLRVTLVYRRDEGEWKLVHRHADPLVKGITLAQSAALARGDP